MLDVTNGSFAPRSDGAAGEARDDDAEQRDDGVDDCLDGHADGADDRHDGGSDRREDALDLFQAVSIMAIFVPVETSSGNLHN